MNINYKEVLTSGRVLGLVGSVNSGKTNTLLNMINFLKEKGKKPACFFYHSEYKESVQGVEHISSIEELEQLENSFIFVDEFAELFQLENRKFNEEVKRVFAQVVHNNNVLILCGVPDYYKKFICSAVENWVLFNLNFAEVVNGSSLKRYITSISGDFIGATRLNVGVGRCLFRGVRFNVEYLKAMDKKAKNNLFEGL